MIPDSPQNPTAHDPTDRHPDGRGPVQQPGSAAPSGSSAPHDRTHGGFRPTPLRLAVYILLGAFFGVVIVKSEVVSWFRIQEMFRFHAFHMYGVIASAIATASISMFAIRKLQARSLEGGPIVVAPKKWAGVGTRYWAGGTLFGIGWAFTGACPGPLFALAGTGMSVIVVVIVSAVAGAWLYGNLRPRLPH